MLVSMVFCYAQWCADKTTWVMKTLEEKEREGKKKIYSRALRKVLGQPKACGRGSHFGRSAGSWGSHRRSGQFQNSQLGAKGLLHINKYHPSMSLLGGRSLICNRRVKVDLSVRMNAEVTKILLTTFCFSTVYSSTSVSAFSSLSAEGC